MWSAYSILHAYDRDNYCLLPTCPAVFLALAPDGWFNQSSMQPIVAYTHMDGGSRGLHPQCDCYVCLFPLILAAVISNYWSVWVTLQLKHSVILNCRLCDHILEHPSFSSRKKRSIGTGAVVHGRQEKEKRRKKEKGSLSEGEHVQNYLQAPPSGLDTIEQTCGSAVFKCSMISFENGLKLSYNFLLIWGCYF